MTIYSPRPRRKHKQTALAVALFFFLMVGGMAWSAYSLVQNLPNPARIADRAVVESTKIYDRTEKVLLYEIHGEERRTVIPLSEVPAVVRGATLAAEDIHFYQHPGIDIKGIVRAFLSNLRHGEFSQGGSTITQQLIKNSLLGSEKTLRRKIREQILALLLERKYSKDEILELYLNQIPYGSNAYGIAAAAQTYFSKSVPELTLAEAASLAALPKAPTYYSPYGSHRDELVKRRDWILDRMGEARLAGPDEVARAKREKVSFAPPKQGIRAPHFVFFVRDYLNEKYGESFVEGGGLKVVTTLDWKLQSEAEKIVREGAEQNEKTVQASNAALVAIDPRTGEILAMVGSRDYWGTPLPTNCTPGASCHFDPHVNVATRLRQPGSAFKPFVYATAFQRGYTPETVLFDAPTEFNPNCTPDGRPGPLVRNAKECYNPEDYDGQFRGPVTLRRALAQSLNVPSVKLLYLAGVSDSIKTAQGMGISSLNDPDRYGLSLVLGGAEVSLLEMTSAFGSLAQEGILHPKTSILRVENSKGVVLEEHQDSSLPVLDTEIARTLNDILSDNDARVPVFSPRSALYFSDRKVAAKTGTTQESRDAWVVGYTPSLTVGVWAGNNDNSPMSHSALSVLVAAPIWHRFLEFALQSTPPEDFTPPLKQNPEKAVLRGHYRAGSVIKIDKISRKLATAYTPPDLVEEINVGEPHSILSFVRRDDPLGDAPADPSQDPQYRNWEAGVQQWLSQHPPPTILPPTQVDDLHTPEKQPHLQILSPADATLRASSISDVVVSVQSPFLLTEVSLFVDDELVHSKTNTPSSRILSFPLGNPLSTGVHRFKIIAYDAVGNTASLEKEITLTPSE